MSLRLSVQCIPSYPHNSPRIQFEFPAKNKFPAKVDENLLQNMGPWYKFLFESKSRTFRQLPT